MPSRRRSRDQRSPLRLDDARAARDAMRIINSKTRQPTTREALLRLFPRQGSVADPDNGIRTKWSNPPTAEQLASVGYEYTSMQLEDPPREVPNFKVKHRMEQLGLLDAAEVFMQNADALTKRAWETNSQFSRDSELMKALANHLGLTQPEVDSLMTSAARLKD